MAYIISSVLDIRQEAENYCLTHCWNFNNSGNLFLEPISKEIVDKDALHNTNDQVDSLNDSKSREYDYTKLIFYPHKNTP